MPKPFKPSASDLVKQVQALENRLLSDEDFIALRDSPMSEEERQDFRGLVDWFTRRYPTPAARLAYIRRKRMECEQRFQLTQR